MERSFLDYAMSVIVSRALPDVRDGLKPVHRRILYDMFDQGFRPDRLHVKCARVTGDVMVAVPSPRHRRDLRRAGRAWRSRSACGTRSSTSTATTAPPTSTPRPSATPSAGCRSSPMQLLAGIDEETVDFVDNYSGEFQGPAVLPARFPNLLVNGSQGIAVGMATNIPPHNLGEVIDAVVHLIDHPDATPDDLMQFVKGPDFPTGGSILGRAGIIDAYRTGRGSIRMRADGRDRRDEGRRADRGHRAALPDLGNRDRRLASASSRTNKTVDGIRSIDNVSAGDGTRLVIELKRDANANVVLNNLYKHTPLQTQLRRQHGGPRRRRAAHAEPRVDAAARTSRIRST